MSKLREIERPGDLKPLGVRSTIRGDYSSNEIFEQLCKLKNELEIKRVEMEDKRRKKL